MSGILQTFIGSLEVIPRPPQDAYIFPGTYSWVAPDDVTSVCAVAVGGGGGAHFTSYLGHGGGGGGLGWENNIPVVPGNSYTVVVGAAGVGARPSQSIAATGGGDSYFINVGTVAGYGGDAGNSTPSGAAPYNSPYVYNVHRGGNSQPRASVPAKSAQGNYGGGGGAYGGPNGYNSGGGAGGYSGIGGNGGSRGWPPSYIEQHTAGQGGGGGGGGTVGGNTSGGGGGGVGLLGEGSSGAVGSHTNNALSGGGGGSGGQNGFGGTGSNPHTAGDGGSPGGGGGGPYGYNGVDYCGNGGTGAVRIIWGAGRAFPSTNTGDL